MLWSVPFVVLSVAVPRSLCQTPDVRAFCTQVLESPSVGCDAQCQGRDGKRGPQGIPGISGPKGQKGDRGPGIEDLQQRLQDLEEKLRENEKRTPLDFCALGMKNRKISDSSISTSSSSNRLSGKQWSRLDQLPIAGASSGSWCADSNDRYKWIKVDLGRMTDISGLVTQGSSSFDSWTKTYTVSCGDNVGRFIDLKEFGSVKVFKANSDRTSKVVNFFAETTKCRHVRINLKSWNRDACMRLEILRGVCASPKLHSIYVESSGADDGNTCRVIINGVDRAVKGRGHCVVVYNVLTDVINAKTFDTYGYRDQTTAMIDYLEEVPEASVIAIAVRDATNPERLTDKASDVLEKLGAVGTACDTKPVVRDSWAFVTQKLPSHVPRPPWVSCQHVLRYHGKAAVHASISTSAHYESLDVSPIA